MRGMVWRWLNERVSLYDAVGDARGVLEIHPEYGILVQGVLQGSCTYQRRGQVHFDS